MVCRVSSRLMASVGSMSSGGGCRRVVVEGNIASGKTQFLNRFKNYSQVQVLEEPVAKWCNLRGHNLLDIMYKNPAEYSLTFQSYVNLTRLQTHLRKPGPNVNIQLLERSLYSASYVFQENYLRSGNIKNVDYVVLTEWFNFIKQHIPPIDEIVYLRTCPEVVHKRQMLRGRPEEETISLEFLQHLHDLYDEWLIQKKFPLPHPQTKLTIIDANKDKNSQEMYQEMQSLKIDWGIHLDGVITNLTGTQHKKHSDNDANENSDPRTLEITQ